MLIKVRAPGLAVRVAGFARRLARSLFNAGAGLAVTRVFDGYLVRARRLGKFATADVLDMPGWLAHRGQFRNTFDEATLNAFFGPWLAQGRESMHLQRAPWDEPLYPPGTPVANMPEGWALTGSTGSAGGAARRCVFLGAPTPGDGVSLVAACAPWAYAEMDGYPGMVPAGLVFVLLTRLGQSAIPATIAPGSGMILANASPGAISGNRQLVLSAAWLTGQGVAAGVTADFSPQAVSDAGIAGFLIAQWLQHPAPWTFARAYRCPAFEPDLPATTRALLTMSARVQASRNDPFGRGVVVFADWLLSDPGNPEFDPDAPATQRVVHVDDPADLANVYSRPQRYYEASAVAGPCHDHNKFGVAYAARVAPHTFAVVLRHWCRIGEEESVVVDPEEPPRTRDDYYATVRVLWLTITVDGAAVQTETVVDPAPAPTLPPSPDHPFLPAFDFAERWFCRGLGMDSDGETAVYVGAFDWRLTTYVAAPDYTQREPWQSDFGVLVITAGAHRKLHFANPGFWAPDQQPQLMTPDSVGTPLLQPIQFAQETGCTGSVGRHRNGLVTYIGNGKFVFPVLVGTRNPDSLDLYRSDQTPRYLPPFSGQVGFALAQFDLADDGLTLLATLHTEGTYTFDSPRSYPKGLGPVWCVQREITDESGNIVQPAILLINYGDIASGDLSMSGATWISYDSGVTWKLVAPHGTGYGVVYGGSSLHAPMPGALWRTEPVED